MKRIIIGSAVLLSGCIVQPARVYYPPPPPNAYYSQPQQYQPQYQQQAPVDYQAPAPQPVVSVYVDPPLEQPEPVLVGWAPPPMLVESPPPMPYDGAIWTGGFWVWEGNWVWAHGRWASPPQPGYGWVNPYYEHRNGSVVFVNGFWAAPGVAFVAPPMGISISVGIVAAGVVAGPRVNGPEGVFVPAPPGSHPGLIVPAPIGTAPAVVTGAPPIVNQGMRITAQNNARNIGNGTNISNVTIVAPAGATASGRSVNSSVPLQPHLAAAMPPVVHAYAPDPVSTRPIPAYVAGHQPLPLPAPQVVHAVVPPTLNQPHQVMQQQQQRAPQSLQPPVQNYQQPGVRQTTVPTVPETRPQQFEQKPQQFEQKPQPQQMEQRFQQPAQQKPSPAPAPVAQPKNKDRKEGSERKPESEHERER